MFFVLQKVVLLHSRNGGAQPRVPGEFFEQDGDEQQTSRRFYLRDLKTGPGQTKENKRETYNGEFDPGSG